MTITYNSTPDGLLTYSSPSPKLTRQADGIFRYQPHNLYINSAAPANQSITVVQGATYEIIITGSVSITWSGAFTGTTTAGTHAFTAATGTLTGGSTSGSGTVSVRRTPSANTYVATVGAAVYRLPYEWDASGNPLGIRVESARTNMCVRSNQIDNASWTKGGATVTANAVNAPDGTSNADFLVEDTSTGDHRTFNDVSLTSGTTYTFSVFLRPNGRNIVQLFWSDGVTTANVTFNVSTGVIVAQTAGTGTITPEGGGWYRCAVTRTAAATAATVAQIRLIDTGTNTSYTGNGSSGVSIWGAQFEVGSTASSPIETFGSTVTRAVDNVSLATSAFPYNQPEGTVIVKAIQPVYFVGGRLASLSTLGDLANRVVDPFVTAGPTISSFNGTETFSSVTVVGSGNLIQAAAAYKTADYALVVNGGTVATSSSATVNTATGIQIGATGGGGNNLNGWVQSVLYLPRRMTNAELQASTA